MSLRFPDVYFQRGAPRSGGPINYSDTDADELVPPARSARGVPPATHPPRLSTAADHPASEPHSEEPPPIAARSRWSRCRACCGTYVSLIDSAHTSSDLPSKIEVVGDRAR